MLVRLTILLGIAMLVAPGPSLLSSQQTKSESAKRKPDLVSGETTFIQYCASCHGKTGKGDGPAASAMKTPPPDLTTLTRRNEGKFPAGYVSALLKFGRNFASHGSTEMPVWGTRFRSLDPANDSTGQKHIDDVVAYINSLQIP
jgi:mono/diheme cytochrome c family protein